MPQFYRASRRSPAHFVDAGKRHPHYRGYAHVPSLAGRPRVRPRPRPGDRRRLRRRPAAERGARAAGHPRAGVLLADGILVRNPAGRRDGGRRPQAEAGLPVFEVPRRGNGLRRRRDLAPGQPLFRDIRAGPGLHHGYGRHASALDPRGPLRPAGSMAIGRAGIAGHGTARRSAQPQRRQSRHAARVGAVRPEERSPRDEERLRRVRERALSSSNSRQSSRGCAGNTRTKTGCKGREARPGLHPGAHLARQAVRTSGTTRTGPSGSPT